MAFAHWTETKVASKEVLVLVVMAVAALGMASITADRVDDVGVTGVEPMSMASERQLREYGYGDYDSQIDILRKLVPGLADACEQNGDLLEPRNCKRVKKNKRCGRKLAKSCPCSCAKDHQKCLGQTDLSRSLRQLCPCTCAIQKYLKLEQRDPYEDDLFSNGSWGRPR